MILRWNIRFVSLGPLGLTLAKRHIDQFARDFGRLARLFLVDLIRQGFSFVEDGDRTLLVFADDHFRMAQGIAGARRLDLIQLALIL